MQSYVQNFSTNSMRLFNFSEVYIDRSPKKGGEKKSEKQPANSEAAAEEDKK
jgi:hypothetical protein